MTKKSSELKEQTMILLRDINEVKRCLLYRQKQLISRLVLLLKKVKMLWTFFSPKDQNYAALSVEIPKANHAGRCLIGRSEGLCLTAYPDDGGTWTIGWGTTHINGKPVTERMRITKEQAVAYFNQDIAKFEYAVWSSIKVPLTNNQFSALVSLAYNIGIKAFKSSTLVKKLNAEDYKGAVNEFSRWIYVSKVKSNGLAARREKEKALFLTPDN